MKLRSKIHLYTSVLFALLLIAASVTIYAAFSRMSISNELQQLKAEAQHAAADIKQRTDRLAIEELLRAYVPLNGMIAYVAQGDTPLVVTSASEWQLSKQTLQFHSMERLEKIELDQQSYGFVSIPVIAASGEVVNLQLMISLRELMGLLRMLRIVLLIVALCVMLPAVISSRVLGSVIMQPIAEMIKTMKQVAKSGNFVRLKQAGRSKDELLEMGESFNEMIALLESNYSRQEQFVANASHELKTPITVIESYASLLKRRLHQQPELLEESLEAIHSEAVRMKAMTEQLLLLAKPNRQWQIKLTEFDAVGVVERTAANFEKAYGRQVELQLSQQGAVMIISDEDKLCQLLIILLDNARKYSEAAISVAVSQQADGCVIAVKDSGIGIAQDELERVFEPFYRVDKARSRDESVLTGGIGLGLSLAKEIAEATGVRLELQSKEGVGTTAAIHIPAFSAKSNKSELQ